MYYEKMGELLDNEVFARLVLDNGNEVEYLVSNYGRVWSEKSNKFLAYRINNNGRKLVEICVNGDRIVLAVARAIALAFYGPVKGMEADHIDNNPTNDVLENIQWLTPEENKRKFCYDRKKNNPDSYIKGLGENSCNHKYSNETIRNACILMEQGYDSKYISKETGVAIHTLKKIKSRTGWVTVSKDYKVENMTKPKKLIIPKDVSNFINEQLKTEATFEDIQQQCIELFDFEVTREILINRKSKLKREG